MKYKRIRSLTRGIEVLRYLNRVRGAHPVDIGKELGLPRPTVHRILESLEELELVYQGPNSREFRVTPGVRRLSGGGGNFADLRAAALPIMRDLTAEVVWPSCLAVFHGDAMLIVESTDRLSPMSSDVGMIGQSRSVLMSALGHAYLSHCSRDLRQEIIARLCKNHAHDCSPTRGIDGIEEMVEAGSRDGFSLFRDLQQGSTMSIAVPLRLDGTAIASLSIMWHVADLTSDQAQERLSRPLLLARERIEAKLSRSAWTSTGSCDHNLVPLTTDNTFPKRVVLSRPLRARTKATAIVAI